MWVYVISGEGHGTKVGRSAKPRKRLKDLQASTPIRLRLEFLHRCGADARKIERETHRLLAPCKIKGEWFDCGRAVANLAVEAAHTGCGRRLEFLRLHGEAYSAARKNRRAGATLFDELEVRFPDFFNASLKRLPATYDDDGLAARITAATRATSQRHPENLGRKH